MIYDTVDREYQAFLVQRARKIDAERARKKHDDGVLTLSVLLGTRDAGVFEPLRFYLSEYRARLKVQYVVRATTVRTSTLCDVYWEPCAERMCLCEVPKEHRAFCVGGDGAGRGRLDGASPPNHEGEERHRAEYFH